MKFVLVVFFLIFAQGILGDKHPLGPFSRIQGRLEEPLEFKDSEIVGSPLLLDMNQQPEELRKLAKVTGLKTNIESYAGFLKTNEKTDNNLFFWYFPPQNGDKNAPNLIWLQGGPGGSSLFGLFAEMGPFGLKENMELYERESSWNKKYGMIFIDNPVGAGFSYTTKDSGYATNEQDVSNDLYQGIRQFYQIFEQQLKNDLYITGESYGGHYVPAFGYKIHQENQKENNVKIPFKGVAIGDGWIDPINMLPAYADMMFNMGMVDVNEKAKIESYVSQTMTNITKGDNYAAFTAWDQMLNGDVFPYPNYFHNVTGSNDYDNLMNTNAPKSFSYYTKFVNQPEVRKAIHVGNATFNDGHECEMHLLKDFMVSMVEPQLTTLLENYKVLIYSGQLDIIIGAALTERFMPMVKWSGQQQYVKEQKKVWRIKDTDQDVAGYVRQVKQLTQVVVRGAGHIVPGDQPWRALDMINRFVENIPYKNLPNPEKQQNQNLEKLIKKFTKQ